MNLGVGWVEGRNPTPEEIGIVGFHSVQPNLHLFLSSQSDRSSYPSTLQPIHQIFLTIKIQ